MSEYSFSTLLLTCHCTFVEGAYLHDSQHGRRLTSSPHVGRESEIQSEAERRTLRKIRRKPSGNAESSEEEARVISTERRALIACNCSLPGAECQHTFFRGLGRRNVRSLSRASRDRESSSLHSRKIKAPSEQLKRNGRPLRLVAERRMRLGREIPRRERPRRECNREIS